VILRITLPWRPRTTWLAACLRLRHGLKLAAGGLALGLAIAFPVALIMASKVHGFSPWSISALGLSSVIVMVAAVAAAAQPATRVLRIQPCAIVPSE
jgi:hypothetical protein